MKEFLLIIETALATFLFTKAGEFLFYYLKYNRNDNAKQRDSDTGDSPEKRTFVPDERFSLPLIICLIANGITVLLCLFILLSGDSTIQ